MVKVQFDFLKGAIATCQDGVWSSTDIVLARLLQLRTDRDSPRSPSMADPDRQIADAVAVPMGGLIIFADPPPKYVSGRIY